MSHFIRPSKALSFLWEYQMNRIFFCEKGDRWGVIRTDTNIAHTKIFLYTFYKAMVDGLRVIEDWCCCWADATFYMRKELRLPFFLCRCTSSLPRKENGIKLSGIFFFRVLLLLPRQICSSTILLRCVCVLLDFEYKLQATKEKDKKNRFCVCVSLCISKWLWSSAPVYLSVFMIMAADLVSSFFFLYVVTEFFFDETNECGIECFFCMEKMSQVFICDSINASSITPALQFE